MTKTRLLLRPALVVTLLVTTFVHVADTAAPQSPAATRPGVRTLSVPGLGGRVTVRRDERGIPYIEAESEEDLYLAQGYVTASDRLWQMELLRRNARGELSEIFGSATLEEDKRRRTYGFAALAEGAVARSSRPVRASLEAYARGVNAYIAALDQQTTPPEFRLLGLRPREWRPADSVVIGKVFAEVLSRPWSRDVMRAALSDVPPARLAELMPETSALDVLVVGSDAEPRKKKAIQVPAVPRDRRASARLMREAASFDDLARRSAARVGLDAAEQAASNNWVVSGARTATGKPLLANDPHLSPSAPSVWYMTHLSAPGLRVAGVTAPGAPGVIIGHNERVAWGVTNLGPDVQDVYAEKFDAASPPRYMTPQGWREAAVRREEIRVRKGPASAETSAVSHDVVVTRNGPVVMEKEGARYSLRWTALDPEAVEFEGFYYVNRARDWDEFRAALARYQGPTQNFVYADVGGNIGYNAAGLVPVRRTGDGSVPYDGTTDAGEWTGYIPFEQMPHVYNPPGGVIVTANSRVVGRSYPQFLSRDWAAPYRARRIYDLLQSKKKLTADDFGAIQGDVYTIGGTTFAKAVARAGGPDKDQAGAPGWRETLTLFGAWDGRLSADSRAAPLVAEMRNAFRRRVISAVIGAERARTFRWGYTDVFLDRVVTERPREWLPKEFASYAELLRACEKDAREALSKRLGADSAKWTWGSYQQVRFPHPLASVPLFGQQFVITPFPQQGSEFAGGSTPNVGAAVSMRLIADPSDWDRTRQGIAPGESGDPRSPHWQDQLADWRAVTPRAFPFTRKSVEAATRGVTVLEPAAR